MTYNIFDPFLPVPYKGEPGYKVLQDSFKWRSVESEREREESKGLSFLQEGGDTSLSNKMPVQSATHRREVQRLLDWRPGDDRWLYE